MNGQWFSYVQLLERFLGEKLNRTTLLSLHSTHRVQQLGVLTSTSTDCCSCCCSLISLILSYVFPEADIPQFC